MRRTTRRRMWGGPVLPAALELALLAVLVAFTVPVAADDVRPPEGEVPGDPTAFARYLGTREHVAVIEISGELDRTYDGEVNALPRALVAREFFDHHPDRYDFLVVFSDFEFDTGRAEAFHLGTRNDVSGIGLPLYDDSALYGSAGRLRGYVDMAALARHPNDPLDPAFEETLTVLIHELFHQWVAHVSFRTEDGSVSDALLGPDGSHWSYLLDTGGSVLYGNDWRPDPDGGFTSAAALRFLSPLDLYLAGFVAPEEVPPFTLIENPSVDPGRLPRRGERVEGTAIEVTLDDVIAAEGLRQPAFEEAPKELRAAFVYLVRPGAEASDAEIAALERIREGLATRFAVLTGGRGILEVFPEALPVGRPGAPEAVPDGTPRGTEASVLDGLAWLRSRQTAEGYWQDRPATRSRDTTVTVSTLTRLDPLFTGEAEALDWLSARSEVTTDSLARIADALAARGRDASAARAALAARQNPDGGWGIGPGYASDPLDTALAVRALATTAAGTTLARAADFLEGAQGADGGWGGLAASPGRTSITLTALGALRVLGREAEVAPAALAFLAARQNPDGGFGDSPSTVHDTAGTVELATALGAGGAFDLEAAAGYLGTRQSEDGSWEGSVYKTALAVGALQRLSFPNLAVTAPLAATPAAPSDGERVRLTLGVGNDGNLTAPSSRLVVYDGDPAGGAPVVAEALVPNLPPRQQVEVTLSWDTLDAAGAHRLVAVLDADAVVGELSETDNRSELEVTVAPAPAGVDLAIAEADVTVSPAAPTTLPAELAISVTVRNVGQQDAPETDVELREVAADGAEVVLERITVSVPGRSSAVVHFVHVLDRPGTTRFAVVVDPDGAVAEASEANNRAEAAVSTLAGLDFDIPPDGVRLLDGSPYLGADLTFEVTVINRGTVDSPQTDLRAVITDGETPVEIGNLSLQLDAGESAVRTVVWRVDRLGPLELVVEIDPLDQAAETDETNNVGTLTFDAVEIDSPNLTLGQGDLAVSPLPALEGAPLELAATVRNTGAGTLTDIEVGFYNGDPAQGAPALGPLVVIPEIASGATATATLVLPRLARAGDWLVYAVVDPDDHVAELLEDDNGTFSTFDALSLPNLAVSPGALALVPRFPRPGETVSLTVSVTNLGEQPADDAVVRVTDGDPATGGAPVAADGVIPSIAGGATGRATFDWTYGSAGAGLLVVAVDPDGVIEEGSTLDNEARLEVAAQDRDLFVTERFISPDGDGFRDATDLFFRFQAGAAASVEVVDERGQAVRIHAFPGPLAEGHFEWNGLDDLGRVVIDGDYRLRPLDDTGDTLGQAVVTVDTDRSSLLDAEGTPYGKLTNLTCTNTNEGDWVYFSDDAERFYFESGEGTLALPYGIYSVDATGGDQRIFRESRNARMYAVSPDGGRIAYKDRGDSGTTLRVADADGTNEVDVGFFGDPEFYFTGDGGALISSGESSSFNTNTIDYIPLDGSPAEVLYTSAERTTTWGGVSPAGDAIVFHRRVGSGYEIWYLDVATRRTEKLRDVIWPGYAWAPDGERFLVLDDEAAAVYVYDRDGAPVAELRVPLDHMADIPTYRERFGELPRNPVQLFDIWPTPTWSRASTEFAFRARIEEGRNGYAGLFRADLLEGTVRPVAWLDPIISDSGGASYHVETWDGAGWVERGVLSYGLHYGEQFLDLEPYLPDPAGEHKVRIRQSGKEAAHVEAVALTFGPIGGRRFRPSAATRLRTGADVLDPITGPDREVLDLHEAAMEVRWEGVPPGPAHLSLIAREEDLSTVDTVPFRFPADVDGSYPVLLTGGGAFAVDGRQGAEDGIEAELFAVDARPRTGHPRGIVYGYTTSDAGHLYAALDFVPDNTRDGLRDWASIEVLTDDGWREFRVTEEDSTWGRVGFVETGKARHRHKYYEFAVPLAEIGAATGDRVEVRFSAYGTAALFEEPEPLMPIGSTDWAEPLWVPFESSLLFIEPFVWSYGVWMDEDNRVDEIFEDRVEWGLWYPRFTRSGRKLVFWDGSDYQDPSSPCYDIGWLDHAVFESRLNLTAELRPRRSEDRTAIELHGTASDRHFSHYLLEYTPADTPDAWRPLRPASEQPVLDGLLATWVPPGPGSYFVRLTVEDLAGNRRRVVKRAFWSDTPTLTDLFVEPEVFSPNGDGNADTTRIHYRVLTPVNLQIRIYDADGRTVRTLRRDHPTVGEEVDVVWDGRDDRGLPVAAGEYRIDVLGFELFVEVDPTAPVVELETVGAYREGPRGLDPSRCGLVDPIAGVRFSIDEPRLVGWSIESGLGADPVVWDSVGLNVVPTGDGSTANGEQRLEIAEFVGRSFRLEAYDAAGNRGVATTSLGAEELILAAAGSHAVDPETGALLPLGGVPYEPRPGERPCSSDPLVFEPGPLRLGIAESLRAQLAELYVEWRPVGQEAWHRTRIDEFLVPGTLAPRTAPPDHVVSIVWPATDVPLGQVVHVRLVAVDDTLAEHVSNGARLLLVGSAETITFAGRVTDATPGEVATLYRQAVDRGDLDPAVDLPLWVQLNSPSATLAQAELAIDSAEDPRYDLPVIADLVALGDRVALFRLTAWSPCTAYRGVAAAVTSAGGELESAPREVVTPCFGLDFESTPIWAEACGDPSPHRLLVTVTPRLDADLTLQLLAVEREDAPGAWDTLFSINRPVNGEPYVFELDPRDFAEGVHRFRARLTTLEGETEITERDVVMDVTPPQVALTYPVEGQTVCGGVWSPSGEIDDAGGFGYRLELGRGHEPTTWQMIADGVGLADDGRLVVTPAVEDCGCLGGAAGLSRVAGELGTYGDFCPAFSSDLCLFSELPFSGEATLRLQVFDRGGFHECVETRFVVDGTVEGAAVDVFPTFFSPNGDGALDEAQASVRSDEAVTADVHVHRGYLSVEGPVFESPALRTLATDLSVVGAVSLVWDGSADDGSDLPDGNYLVAAGLADGCANPAEEVGLVVIDTVPPVAEITYPTPGAPLATMVEVVGNATDDHFASYTLEVGVGADPVTWAMLANGAAERVDRVLGAWNTHGLAGDFVLRLVARDRAGNVTETRVPVFLAQRNDPISALEAVPALFSPNGDGRRETTAVRLGLTADATVDLRVLDAGGAPVRALVAGAARVAGSEVVPWDGTRDGGSPAPDGVYQVSLRAALAANPLVTQEERVTVVLDRTPPAIDLDRPADGDYLTPTGFIVGSVEDPNLVSWAVSIADDPAAPSWFELDRGTVSTAGTTFGSLADLSDGPYAVRVEAEDEGEIRAARTVSFVVDGTPPAVELTAPTAGAFVGGDGEPVAVRGAVADENLEAWWLEAGAGTEPESWQTLATGTAAPTVDPFFAWDVSAIADGPWVLRLRARDLAGNETQTAVPVRIDRTPPVTILTAPADGDYVKGPMPVEGTATDANLLDYRIEVAAGGASAAEAWTTVGTGSEAVDSGLLLDWQSLPPDGLHTLRLTVRDRAGNEATDSVEVTVDLRPPAAPLGLTAEVVDRDDVALSWDASAESDVVGYVLRRNGTPVGPNPIESTSTLDPDLAHGPYRYTVAAVDRAGWESPPSAPAEVEIDLRPPETRIAVPADGASVNGLVEVRGTAYAARDFREYRLWLGEGDGSEGWQLLRRSPVPVQSGDLGEWRTLGLAEGGIYTLRLEAEDLQGNVGEARVTVTLDNLPPARPTGLTATVESTDVVLSWQPVADPDLHGYLLYRDGRLVNLDGAVADGDLLSFAIPDITYRDPELADGTYRYEVEAIDTTGNASEPSDPADATIETGPPAAVIVRPEDGAEFEEPLFVQAVAEATDVESVQFQYRAVGDTEWSDLGAADLEVPFDVTWDPAGLTFGDFELRAVATDRGGLTDPAPAAITVTYADLTPPEGPLTLEIAVDGGEVALSWDAVTDPESVGYLVDRVGPIGARVRLTADPISATDFDDLDVADGDYRYEVVTTDVGGNESLPVAGDARVYTPELEQPYTPILDRTVALAGRGAADAVVAVELTTAGGTAAGPDGTSDADGAFTVTAIPLLDGPNVLSVRLTDPSGDRSKAAEVTVVGATPPAPPTGLAGTETAGGVLLSWDPGPEPDLFGYRPFRDGEPLLADKPAAFASAVASSQFSSSFSAFRAIDGNTSRTWFPDLAIDSAPWIEVTLPDSLWLTAIELRWADPAALDYDLAAWDGRAWVPLARERDNEERTVLYELAQPYVTARLRVSIHRWADDVGLSEIFADHRPLVATPSYEDLTGDGTYLYAVTAVDDDGFESGATEAEIPVGDVEPPPAVTLTASVDGSLVDLAWTASSAPDLASYEIFRDGAKIADHVDLANTVYSETRPNGTYVYTVRPVDAVGNTGAQSNPAEVVVDVPVHPAPYGLTVTGVPTGGALDLAWSFDGAEPPTAFRVRRSTVAGGPHEPVADVAGTTHRDTGLTDGQTYHYVVTAADAAGNESAPSNEASGTPEDIVPPAVPQVRFPAAPGWPYTTDASQLIMVAGLGEPGSRVTLSRDGLPVGEADARTFVSYSSQSFFGALEVRGSPTGEHAFVRFSSGRYVYSWMTGLFSITPIPGTARWSADGERLVYPDGGVLRSYELRTATVTDLAFVDSAATVLEAPGEDRLVVLGVHGGVEGLWLVGPGSAGARAWTLLVAAPVAELDPEGLAWSPDGGRLTLRRTGTPTALDVVDLSGGTLTGLDPDAGPSPPRWSPDGTALLYTSLAGGSEQVLIERFDGAGGVPLTTGPATHRFPVWSPDGATVGYWDDEVRDVVTRPLDGGVETELGFFVTAVDRVEWPRWGTIFLWRSTGYLVRPRGHFGILQVDLQLGESVLTAVATDAAGNQSGVSTPVTVIRVPGGDGGGGERPDLVVEATDLLIVPAVPVVGGSARATITVHNRGTAAAPASTLDVEAFGPDGWRSVLADGVALPALDPDISTTVQLDLALGPVPGHHRLDAEVDPGDAVAESDETNNRAQLRFPVLAGEGPGLFVDTDRSSYGPGEPVVIGVELINAGPVFSGQLEVAVEDADGFLVETLPVVPVDGLATGASTLHELGWSTGDVFAGDYRVRASLVDPDGFTAAESEAPFSIVTAVALVARIETARATYAPGETVRLTGTAGYPSGNGVISDLEGRIAVLDLDGVVLQESAAPLTDLFPGGEATAIADWPTGGTATGLYRGRFEVLRGGAVVTSAETLFELASGERTLAGALALSEREPAVGTALDVAYTVENLGTAPLAALPVRVSLVDPDAAIVRRVENMSLDLAAGATAAGEVTWLTDDLPLEGHLVILEADLPDGAGGILTRTLAALGFTPVDATPPVVEALDPTDGATVPAAFTARATAFDLHSEISRVELAVDGGPPAVAVLESAPERRWGVALDGLPDGERILSWRAVDVWGNESVAELTVTIEAGAPELSAAKADALALDADGDGMASPGDEISYAITVANVGGAPATDVALDDPIPAHATVVAGSVESDRGTVAGEDPVRVEIGTLAAGEAATVTFRVFVDLPVPAGVDRIENQGTVTSAELPAVDTDDPDAGGDRDPTLTLLAASPDLAPELTDALALDADGDGVPSPGDTVEYLATIRNRGNTAATAVTLALPVPLHATLVPGSATAGQGTVTEGDPVVAELGEIAGGAAVVVRVRVRVDSPVAVGVDALSAQGLVTSAELPDAVTDDPELDGPADPTVTPIDAAPDLVVEKTATLAADDDGDGLASPGDLLRYRVSVLNRGNTAATTVILTDPVPEATVLEPGSVQAMGGSVTGEDPVVVETDRLDVEAELVVTFEVRIDPVFPLDRTEVANQATVESAELGVVPSDDPATAEPGDPTVTEVFVTPEIAVAAPTGDEGAGPLAFAVTLSEPSNRPLSVAWATADGSALGGVDFVAASSRLDLAAGETGGEISIELIDDLLDELDETFTLVLSDPQGATLAAGGGQVTGTIVDDDPAPAVSVTDSAVAEGSGQAVVTVALSAPSGLAVSVDWQTADVASGVGATAGQDYAATAGTVTFPAGVTTATVEVPLLNDLLDEPNEDFLVLLTGANGAALAAGAEARITLLDDDDPPSVSIAAATVTEGGDGDVAELRFPVTLSAPSGRDTSVGVSTVAGGTAEAGVDFTPLAATVTFPAGSTTAEAIVEVLGDALPEPDETVLVELTAPVFLTLGVSGAVGTIENDDVELLLRVDDAAVIEGDPAEPADPGNPDPPAPDGPELAFRVWLSAPAAEEITVSFATEPESATEGTDYLSVAGEVTFAPGESEHVVTVPVVPDLRLEADEETLLLRLSDARGASLDDDEAVGTIVDDEPCHGPNLLANPGAETTTVDGELPGWREVEGETWTRRTADPSPASGGAYFYAGEVELGELEQDADVRAYEVRVDDAAGQRFAFSGHVRTYDEAPPDTARIVVEYRDRANDVVLDAFDTGELTSPDAWLEVGDERLAPAGTGWIRVRLVATRFTEERNDGYFDDLSLRSVRAPLVMLGDWRGYEGGPGNSAGSGEAVFELSLACPLDSEVSVAWETADGTAKAGEDYVAGSGVVTVPAGEPTGEIRVPILGDTDHELHETFTVTLSEPTAMDPAFVPVLLDPVGEGTILGDDFCARSSGFWKTHRELWPVDGLVLGDRLIDGDDLQELLGASNQDASRGLARQLAAAKLNLLVGSDPWILPTVDHADAFLLLFPIGSSPKGEDKELAIAIKDELDAYNNPSCEQDPVTP